MKRMKTNLPVIILKDLILLPNNEIRLEFNDSLSKTIIDASEIFNDNNIFVVTKLNPLEENITDSDLPKIGVIARISHKLELPNGVTRVVITGLTRGSVIEYLKQDDQIVETIVSPIPKEEHSLEVKTAMIRKLYREVEIYVKSIPYMSNSLLSLISNQKDLDKITDIVVSHLPISFERTLDYLLTISSSKRVEMILQDIYGEEQLFNIEKDLDLKVKKELDESQKEFILKEKIKLIKEELGEKNSKDSEIEKLIEKLEKLKCPKNIKERIKNEIDRYEYTPATSPEVNIIRTYIDWMLNLPWKIRTKDNTNLVYSKKQLDNSHYGLEEIKERIIEYLAVKKHTNNLNTPIICLVGPPGVGKTTLAHSIARATNRNFTKISVGGVNDEAEIMGHRRTYLASSPGRIIEGLKRSKSNNPVFLIDEIDKMTKDIKGDPSSALLEVLDKNQNKHFKDNYINEEFDLSNIMFILTANTLETIPAPLLDRLEIINISGYTELEKLSIAKKHLLPKILKEHNLNKLKISNDLIIEIIRNYTKESGVRELERKLEKIVRKVVTEKVVDNKDITCITDLEKYLGTGEYSSENIKYDEVGVVNGLAYTNFGGDILPIEVNYFKGTGSLILTGSLGDIIKESANIALSYIKANYEYFDIEYDKFLNNDIHIHIPDGAIKKDGPSAGIALTTAIISTLTNKKINNKIAMTGEITLRGKVLQIGGLKEKCIGAHKNNIERIIIPFDNFKQVDELSKEIKNNIEFIPVKDYKDVYDYVLKYEN